MITFVNVCSLITWVETQLFFCLDSQEEATSGTKPKLSCFKRCLKITFLKIR